MFLLSTLVLCVHTCLTASSVPYALWLPGHVLPFSVVFPKHTEKSHGSVLWSSTWSAACWLDVVREPLTVTGDLIPVFPVPQPSQAGGMQTAVLQKTQGQTKSGVGGIFVSVVLFGVGRFLLWCGSAVLLFHFWKTLKGWQELWSPHVPASQCSQEMVEDRWPCCVSSSVKFFYRWRLWRIMCVEVFTKVLSVPIV